MPAHPMFSAEREQAEAWDRADPLAAAYDAFVRPPGIYLDGNSLGPLPSGTAERVRMAIEREWGEGLIGSWNTAGWFQKPTTVGDRVGRLIGAAPGQVVVCDTISVNLFKLVCAVLHLRPGRRRIVTEAGNFPSDLYVMQGVQQAFPDLTVTLVEPGGVAAALGPDVAATVLTEVDFRTGLRHDMAATTRAAHDAGALTIWDLAHSAGAFPVALDACDADFAVGCTYKYLNAGPGAPAFLYAARHWHDAAIHPLTGWIGHADPFAFSLDYIPAPDIRRFLSGTPPILTIAALEASLDVFETVDLFAVREKSVRLCELFIELVDRLPAEYGLTVASPRVSAVRGSQVSLRHPNGLAIMRALIAAGVTGDFRAPDILRFGFTPLTLRYADVVDAVRVLDDVMARGRWRADAGTRTGAVT